MNRRSRRVEIDMGPVSGSRRRALTRPMLKPFHRAAEVMQQEGISLRAIISRMNISVEQVRAELDPRRDMRLSELYRWQAALNVPVVDLLVDPGTGLSGSVELRAELLKLMKSVRSIQEKSEDEVIDRLAASLRRSPRRAGADQPPLMPAAELASDAAPPIDIRERRPRRRRR